MSGRLAICGVVLVTAGAVVAVGLPFVRPAQATEPAADEGLQEPVATTEEVQEFDLLWAELGRLQSRAPTLGAEEFQRRFLQLTASYLRLDPRGEAEFLQTVRGALAGLAPLAGTPADVDGQRQHWRRAQQERSEASDRLLDALQPTPRHRLLAQRRLHWLLKLDFSRREGTRLASKTSSSPHDT